ncbi:MAG: transcription termination/antitermination protein NusA [Clostridia bacterium]|nr:transcription termination/antitermination protein NusA [Clostridia bacterium]MBR4439098.1 transcription termination/antitermination protein NusA [Clostridia bacterium]MBR5769479.1 transcription termination/antitermination protein NusA [Clostridia bacterium]MBR5942797.1 transcription termination/antitermination protein NusA [Clostridia bacterium]
MVNKEFFEALDMLEKENGIAKEYMLDRVRAALETAVKRDDGNIDNIEVLVDEETSSISLIRRWTVIDDITDENCQLTLAEAKKIDKKAKLGGEVVQEIQTKEFGRIAAQSAKQVIIQAIREAEKLKLLADFRGKEHEIITALVTSVDRVSRNATLEVGRNSIVLPASEQVKGEYLTEGSRVRIYVVEVKETERGPRIVISRTHPGLVRRLFELEVPEINEGIVDIRAISREAGSRTKVAVASNDPSVDPVGACIGQKGTRVDSIKTELKGEKIDIVRYSDDITEFVTAALSPAEVIGVDVNEEEHTCHVTVPADQLSLAIGKEGQNARLAAKLTGWKIDIKPAM